MTEIAVCARCLRPCPTPEDPEASGWQWLEWMNAPPGWICGEGCLTREERLDLGLTSQPVEDL